MFFIILIQLFYVCNPMINFLQFFIEINCTYLYKINNQSQFYEKYLGKNIAFHIQATSPPPNPYENMQQLIR